MVNALTFTGLVKHFGEQTVLSNVDFNVQAGEFFGLVGLNGAGKSTLIKCLLDFCAIDAGSIEIFGVDHRKTTSRTHLAFLPEKFTPPYYLTGRDFLDFMSELHGHAYDDAKVFEMLKILDLDRTALSKPVYQYSKGMGQKLGLISCLISGKRLLIFDEPMSGLDPRAMVYLKNHLLDIKQHGYTLFFSTHLLVDIETLCDRMAILHEGKIYFIGTSDECKKYYKAESLDQAYIKCVDNAPGH